MTYEIQSPGGVWDPSDKRGLLDRHATYTGERDSSGNYVPAGAIGSFNVSDCGDTASTGALRGGLVILGISSSDDVTNFNNTSPSKALQFVIAQTNPEARTVTLFSDGVAIGSTVASGNTTIVASKWQCSAIPDGVHTFTVTQTPPGGSATTSSTPLQVTIDTIAPSIPSTPQIQAASDSGFSTNDGITNIAAPTFSLNGAALFPGLSEWNSGEPAYGSSTYTSPTLADETYTYTATSDRCCRE